MNEHTLIKYLDIPPVPGFAWYGDANIVGLSKYLDAAGQERALSEVQDYWRRSCLRVVGSGARGAASGAAVHKPDLPMVEAL